MNPHPPGLPPRLRGVLVAVLPLFLLLASFGGGYIVGQVDALSGARPLPVLLRRAGLGAVADRVPVADPADGSLTADERRRFAPLWEAFGLVTSEWYRRDQVDRQRLVYGAVRGMVGALGDPYTLYLDPVDGALAESDLRGSFDGIGVQVDMQDGRLTVVAPLDGSPGERAGLRPADVITQVDGRDVRDLSLSDAVLRIRGPRGSSVTLTIARPGLAIPFDVSVARDAIKVDSVKSRMLADGIGYLRISSFGSTTGAETERALRGLLDQHPRGIVLDLRSNPGGYVDAAVDVASEFVARGVVLYQQPADGEREPTHVRGDGLATTMPLVVLVNHGSASASEIVAAALRDNGRATLVGQTTFGKGTMQSVHELSDRSTVRITSAQWLTPNGKPIQGAGLVPDVEVEQPDDLTPGQDPQLQAAVRQLTPGTTAEAPAAGGALGTLVP